MALRGWKRIPWLLASFRDFEPPEHMPRTSARAHTCTALFTRAPCVTRNREHEKRPAGGRARNAYVQETSTWQVIVVVFTLNRSFYPTTSGVPSVSFLIHAREIQTLWSQTARQRKTKRQRIKVGKSSASVPGTRAQQKTPPEK